MSKKWNKVGYILVLLVIAIAFYIWNCISPGYSDDYGYKFMFTAQKHPDLSIPIKSIGDIFVSQWNHYFSFNGRILIHFFAQLWTALLGKELFNVFNALMLVAFILLLQKYIQKKRQMFWLLISVALILLLPHFNETYLWMTGSMNYTWTAVAMLVFLLLFRRLKDKEVKNWQGVLYVLGGLLLGWTHEGFSLPLTVALVCVGLKEQCFKRRDAQFYWVLGFVLGACFCAFSPSTINRASGSEAQITLFRLSFLKSLAFPRVIIGLRIVYLLLILLCVLHKKSKELFYQVVKENKILLLTIPISLGISFVSGLGTTRAAYGAEYFSMLILLSALAKCKISNQWKNRVVGILAPILGLFVATAQCYAYDGYQESKNEIRQIKAKQHIIGVNACYVPSAFASYTRTLTTGRTICMIDYQQWENCVIAKVYNGDSILFFPEPFLQEIKRGDKSLDEFNVNSPYPFYAKRMKKDVKVNKIKVLLHPTNFATLPFWLRPFARHYGKYTATEYEESRFSIVKVGKWNYLIVLKNELLHDRVARIVLE